MSIKLLNDDLINKIAAGEVIDRPASIVKELIENSIDAKASKIDVSILNGGKDSIEVEDDGIGLTKEELPLAFLRHATSKIGSTDDLHQIYTMGFRGEALPSIASVAKVTVFTNKSDENGIKAELEDGSIKELAAFPTPKGTRIIIYDLFYNMPARKSFLKTTVTEGNVVHDLVCKYALAHPEISFSFKKDDKQYYKTPGNGNLQDVVRAIFGHDFADSLISIDYQGSQYSVQGLISSPDFTKRSRKNQHFFVNSRPIRSGMLYKAIDTAYKGLLISREHPIIIISIKILAEEVDVNVHPQKSEVRFRNEKDVFQIVYRVIKERLSKIEYNPVHKWQSDTNTEKHHSTIHESAERHVLFENNPFDFIAPVNNNNLITSDSSYLGEPSISNFTETPYKIIGQYSNTYILIEYDAALWFIDQHAAEERINYAKLKNQYLNNNPNSQILAFPLTFDLSSRDIELLIENIDIFKSLGFTIEPLGYDSIILRSAPSISFGQEEELILEIIELLKDDKTVDIHDKAIITMACKRSIKAGTRLNFQEMETIIQKLFKTDDYRNCPHGRPTIIKLNHSDIERMFKR
ncbi:MAG TPA: DNA mismatch repair endonuclease MutL [Syntrophomonadaceae bacterium]|nr:DNA mismatch repair endonuclease MutL [Syntrophomonadaceae bacterium]